MRAVIYARFSSEKQSETSLDDQERICRARAVRDGFEILETFSDQSISGSTPLASRPGGVKLLAAMLAERFDVLIVEGLDRLSRDQVESEQICRRFEHKRLRIIGISDGYDSTAASRKIQRGIRGLINEIYLDDLRAKTHRGLTGQVSRGFHAGGLSFGYRSIAVEGGYRLEIDEKRAEIVREIYERFIAGDSCFTIASDLNVRGVASPRGGTWAVSAIYGSPAKGAGILSNELYVGRYVWNRGQWVKDPETGKRQRVDRPKSEWMTEEKPELRILTDAIWTAARSRLTRPRAIGGTRGRGDTPTVLLSGLLRCAICGGSVVAISATHYGCSARKDRGPSVCGGVTAQRRAADDAVVAYVRAEILSPTMVEDFERRVRAQLTEIRRAAKTSVSKRQSRAVELEREVERLIDAVTRIGYSEALAARLKTAEAELKIARAAPASTPDNVTPLLTTPDALARFRRLVAKLRDVMDRDIGLSRDLLREAIGAIAVSNEAGVAWGDIEPGHAIRIALQATGTEDPQPLPTLGTVAGTGYGFQKRRIRLSRPG